MMISNPSWIFFPTSKHRAASCISTELILSYVLQIFAGEAQYEILQTRRFCYTEIYNSFHGVVNAVNATKELNFLQFTHERQIEIAEGFKERSQAEFDKIVGALDSMLVWTCKPTTRGCAEMKISSGKLMCEKRFKHESHI